MREEGFVTWEAFKAHRDKPWRVVHHIVENIRGVVPVARGGVGAHTHVKVDITDTPWAWADVLKAGSNLTDLATRQHAGLTDVTHSQHHNKTHALTGVTHTASGLTIGWVIRATGAGTFAWGWLTKLGTIDTGVWQGTPVASAYIGAHAASHEKGGGDLIDTLANLTVDKLTDIGVTATNIAAGTTGERPGGVVGDMRYNSTLGGFEVYTGAWKSIKFVGDPPTVHAGSHEPGGGDLIDALNFSNTGLRILDTGADHYLTIKPNENLSASRILNIITGDATRTVTLSGNPTLADWFDQPVKEASHVKHASMTVGNEGLHVLDTNASHDLIIKPGSDLSADRILTLTTGNTARTITLNGNPTLNDWFDQSVKQAASPIFATVKLSGLTDNYVPYHVNDATGLANSPMDIVGASVRIATGGGVRFTDYHKIYQQTYSVRTADPATLIDDTDTAFSVTKSYRVKAVVTSTGTNTGAVAVFRGDGTNFTLFKNFEAGTSSNHVEFYLDAGVPKVRLYNHASFYNVSVLTEELYNKGWAFGSEINLYGDVAGQVGIGKVPTEKLDVDGIVKADDFLLAAGVRPNIAWLSDVNIDEWEQGETLAYDADTGQLVDAWGVEYDNPRLVWKMYTEFMGYSTDASPPWTARAIVGGTMVGVPGESNHPGITKFRSSASLNSGYRFAIENDAIMLAGKESAELIFQMKRNVDVRIKFGFLDVYDEGDPVDGAWLDILDGNLYGKTAGNTMTSTTGTFFSVVLNIWYRMKLFINAAASLVTYAIYTCADDTIRWTNTINTNIPTGRATGHGIVATHDGEAAFDLIWMDMMTANRAGAWNR